MSSNAPRFSLAQRLYVTSAVLISMMVALAVIVWTLISREAEHAQGLASNRVPQLQRIAEIELNVTRASLQLRHAILARNDSERDTALNDALEKIKTVQTTLDLFGQSNFTPEGRKAFEPMPDELAAFVAVATENIALIRAQKKEEAFAYLADTTVPARNRLLGPLAAEKKRQGEGSPTR